MVAALREAGRVAKRDAPVVIQVWGAHERCDLEAMKMIARPFLPPRPPDAPPDPDLSQPGELEALAAQAGLTPESAFDTTWAYEHVALDDLRIANTCCARVVTRLAERTTLPEQIPALIEADLDRFEPAVLAVAQPAFCAALIELMLFCDQLA